MRKQFLATVFMVAVLASMLPAMPVKATPGGSLVGLWHFDEGTGSTAADLSLNGNAGILSGGKFGNALEFDGTDDYVQVLDPGTGSSLDVDIITIEAWIYLADSFPTGQRNIVRKGHGSDRCYGLDFYPNTGGSYRKIRGWVNLGPLGGSGAKVAFGTTPLASKQWYHVAMTYDGSNVRVYVDDIQEGISGATSGDIFDNDLSLRIGGQPSSESGGALAFKGKIDEVRISNVVVTFDLTVAPSVVVGETVGLWHFDESVVGSLAYDSSTNHNDGTIYSAKWAGPTWTTGSSGSALRFDGVDDYVYVGDIGVTGDWTIDFYAKLDTTTSTIQYPVGVGPAGGTYGSGVFLAFTYEAGKWGMYDGTNYITGTTPTTAGNWYHITVAKSGTTYSLYLGNSLEASGTLADVDITNLQFGRRPEPGGGAVWYFDGIIDEVRIWNVAVPFNLEFVEAISATIMPISGGATLTVELTDSSLNPVVDVPITFASAGLTFSAAPNTGSDGRTTVTVTDATAVGVYEVTATAPTPLGDVSDTWTLVVYDPCAGFVTGGGWINSLAGAYTADPSLTGKATFGFVSKYQKGASTPTGQTQFVFHAAGMTFHSTSYEWLVVAGAKAMYKGTGTINGGGTYNFILTAWDGQVNGGGGVDKFRIKIWTDGVVIYDNQVGETDDYANPTTMIAGGSIVIHKGK